MPIQRHDFPECCSGMIVTNLSINGDGSGADTNIRAALQQAKDDNRAFIMAVAREDQTAGRALLEKNKFKVVEVVKSLRHGGMLYIYMRVAKGAATTPVAVKVAKPETPAKAARRR